MVCGFTSAKTHTPASHALIGLEVDCVAAIGVMCFSGVHFGGRPFCVEEAAAMEKNYFLDTLFDVINESDALEADLQDIQAERDGLIVRIKDGTVFRLTITDE